ncbi:probable protein phosphatase 2C 37 [Andrographis paniculata]|uniref:probable protein phosphatase 2C 37 n=1 Tax=Andrographis paniculata TaxID=175694 RepID=UPI0021E95036|nr:probable protein phosphatase 2C 37 [Andrographis paniculata]
MILGGFTAILNLPRDPMTFFGHLDGVSGWGGAPQAASTSRSGLPSSPDIRSTLTIAATADASGTVPSRQRGASGGVEDGDEVVAVGCVVWSSEARFPPPSNHQNAPSRVFVGSSSSSAPPRVPPQKLFGAAALIVRAMVLIGHDGVMEDTISIRIHLWSPEIAKFKPVHYFGIFYGHRGSQCAFICESRMHEILQEEVDREAAR